LHAARGAASRARRREKQVAVVGRLEEPETRAAPQGEDTDASGLLGEAQLLTGLLGVLGAFS
jgi:hypothetical protein